MQRFLKNRQAKERVYRRFVLVFLLLFFFAMVVCIRFTQENRDKVQKINESVRILNKGCTKEDQNPLLRWKDEEIIASVRAYYTELCRKQKFAERYDHLRIFMKKGQYQNTYILFVKYRLKIKDIYTEVPGLSTLYAEKDQKSGGYRVGKEGLKGQNEEYVQVLLEHKDVQKLFARTEKEYFKVVESDALLEEALSDLEKAYKDSDNQTTSE